MSPAGRVDRRGAGLHSKLAMLQKTFFWLVSRPSVRAQICPRAHVTRVTHNREAAGAAAAHLTDGQPQRALPLVTGSLPPKIKIIPGSRCRRRVPSRCPTWIKVFRALA